MGGAAPRRAAAHLLSTLEQVDRGGWTTHLLMAHQAAMDLRKSFTHDDLQMAFLLAPRGLVITIPSDPRSAAKELPPTMDTDVLPPRPLSPGSARGVKYIAAGIRRLSNWRRFLDILGAAPDHTRANSLLVLGMAASRSYLQIHPMLRMFPRRRRALRFAGSQGLRLWDPSNAGRRLHARCVTQGVTRRSQ